MKRLIVLFTLTLSLLSCGYDEIPAGKAVVEKVSLRGHSSETSRIYSVVLKPVKRMEYFEIRGTWTDTSGFVIYTDSLLSVGDTIDILK